MPLAPHRPTPATRPIGRRGGFTFIEVMFAVMILGFGVIMIAAMLPVALRQTQTARESVAGTATCEGGFHTLEAAYALRDTSGTTIYNLPGTYQNTANTNVPAAAGDLPEASTFPAYRATTETAVVPLFLATLGDRVDSSDPKTAFIPFYLGDGTGTPRVSVVGVGVRNVPSMSDPTAQPPITDANPSFLLPGRFFLSFDNSPLPVTVTMNDKTLDVGGQLEQVAPNTVTLAGRAGVADAQIGGPKGAAVEGAAVVVRDEQGLLRVLRLSAAVNDASLEWTLAPGGDFTPNQARLVNPTDRTSAPKVVVGYLVGRMLKNPGLAYDAADNFYVGPTQVTQVLESQVMP